MFLALHTKFYADAINTVLNRAAEFSITRFNTKVLNAANFGVPQIRERLFVVGVLYPRL